MIIAFAEVRIISLNRALEMTAGGASAYLMLAVSHKWPFLKFPLKGQEKTNGNSDIGIKGQTFIQYLFFSCFNVTYITVYCVTSEATFGHQFGQGLLTFPTDLPKQSWPHH